MIRSIYTCCRLPRRGTVNLVGSVGVDSIRSGRGSRRVINFPRSSSSPFSSITSSSSKISDLLTELRSLDTSSLCDADKILRASPDLEEDNDTGLKLVDPTRIKPMNHLPPTIPGETPIASTMAGIVRTVQFTEPDDFLPVLRGLIESKPNEVLVVDTNCSTKAVAGEIFATEAARKGLAGIIVDGPVRDVSNICDIITATKNNTIETKIQFPLRLYATHTTPYSGTIQSVGLMQTPIRLKSISKSGGEAMGVDVSPGEIVVGDSDGIVIGTVTTMERLLPVARTIQQTEQKILELLSQSKLSTSTTTTSLSDLMNSEEHIRRRLNGEESQLEFLV